MLFRFDQISKEFGTRLLFSDVSAQANDDERIGLIGRNGCGKTTLLDLLQGTLQPDQGKVLKNSRLRISRIEQLPRFDAHRTVREETLTVFDHFKQWESRLRTLEAAMASGTGDVDRETAGEYEHLRSRLAMDGGYDYPARTEAVLMGLGFSDRELDRPSGQLSGGQVSRMMLARALLAPADLLLLDEPTNHLDLEGLLWLESFLQNSRISYLVISHDRHFLDAATTVTWEITRRRLRIWPGNFSQSQRVRTETFERERKAYVRQQEWKAKTEEFVRRNLYGQKTRQAQSRRKRMDKTEWLEDPGTEPRSVSFRVPEAHRGGALSFALKNAVVGYPQAPLLSSVNLELRRQERVAILGSNGSGKSTLLRTVAGELSLLGGELEWGPNNVCGFYSQNVSFPDGATSVYDCLRDLDLSITDEKLRSYAASFGFREAEVDKSLDQLSGGEVSRLAMARLFYSPTNVLVLDEPTNHLDIESREALEAALNGYGGTLLIVSHDLFFIEQVASHFYLIRDGRLEEIDRLAALRDVLLMESSSLQTPRATEQVEENSTAPEAPVEMSKNERRRREEKLARLELQIETLESQRDQLLDQLNQASDYQKLTAASRRHQEMECELRQLYEKWESIVAELT